MHLLENLPFSPHSGDVTHRTDIKTGNSSAKLLYCPCIETFMTLRKGNAVHCRNPGGWL